MHIYNLYADYIIYRSLSVRACVHDKAIASLCISCAKRKAGACCLRMYHACHINNCNPLTVFFLIHTAGDTRRAGEGLKDLTSCYVTGEAAWHRAVDWFTHQGSAGADDDSRRGHPVPVQLALGLTSFFPTGIASRFIYHCRHPANKLREYFAW